MIQLLATKYARRIAYILFLIFLGGIAPVYGRRRPKHDLSISNPDIKYPAPVDISGTDKRSFYKSNSTGSVEKKVRGNKKKKPLVVAAVSDKEDIGGPNQPEMSSFKSVGTDNMVNLFTGDFSYNIPLMDVGGYPINIFYDGGVSMEQEASWVGLGWNINPGNINRNMRGVPDDFDGTDTLTHTQNMKPNNTWGVNLGGDLEVIGIKDFVKFSGSVGATVGVSFNNYLGPALELGAKGSTGIVLASKSNAEKNASLSLSAGLSANLSSRNGLTVSPNISLNASAEKGIRSSTFGLGLSTSYNSRSGIKALHLSEQMSFSNKIGTGKEKEHSSQGTPNFSTSISFAKPSYVPSLRMPLTNTAFSGHFQLGTGIFGAYGSVEAEVYLQKSEVVTVDQIQKKPLVGYIYYQKANNNPNAVMDFTRFNDGEVTPNTPIISAPQYAYDVFSIQGEGTGGSIRAYRNDHGFVRDNFSRSQDKNTSAGADIGPPGHFGANFNTIKTPSSIGGWVNGNLLANAASMGFRDAKDTSENVYFRNPGETSVLHKDQFKKIGGTDLVRFKLGGTNAIPTIEPVLEQFSKANVLLTTSSMLVADPAERKKRTQVTSFLIAEEASIIGLDRDIKSYDPTIVLNVSNNLQYTAIPRITADRKKHHISQINVTEASGKRYIYGLPVYNIKQKDYSFSVANKESLTEPDKVDITTTEPTTLNINKDKDGFIQITETPSYAHSFLLSGLLSPDYVDVLGDGITEDDMGDAVKFNYTKYADHLWRTPLTSGTTPKANFNPGNRTETKDDKGIISYGQRESWYAHSIESKTMIALFTLEDRKDAKGPTNEFSGVNATDISSKRLKKIDLYSKADLKKNGLSIAKPIKTVWFAYSYSLCGNTPDNNGVAETLSGVNVNSAKGKLTLDSIYFTFNGKNRINKNKYVFSYGGVATNQAYAFNASDRWGNYKPVAGNPAAMKNGDYPYSIQDKTQKATIDSSAAAWSLKKILLPSGGQIEVEYETDDYAFVQNRRAATMMEIEGLGTDSLSTPTDKLYALNALSITDNLYVFIKVPEPCTTKTEVFQKYIDGLNQLAFKVAVNMPKGVEYINSYATITDWGRLANSRIWIKLQPTDGISPLTLTAVEYLREQLPGQAFKGYDVSETAGLKQVGEMLLGMLQSLIYASTNPLDQLRIQRKAQTIIPGQSFVRLNDPDGYKYGGGQRVKSVKLKDNWKHMTGQYTSQYGQQYEYKTTEMFNGVSRTISSGVASYEPSIGGEENPFQTILQVSNKLPLGPASYGAVEMPVLDAFFPAPVVGYSKVTVKAMKNINVDTTIQRSRSGIGKQVSEFFTAKDFPVYFNHTSFDNTADKQKHDASMSAFFYKYAFDSRALSQGFVVETNDMHGKMRSQSSYAENDSNTRINYTENFYRNTGSKGLLDTFDFVYGASGGNIVKGNMGIDVELMTDTREFSVKSSSLEVQGQLDLFPVILPFWLPFIWPVFGNSENTYRAVTTTKVISYHGVLDSVVVIDKGSRVATKNLVYDSETGEVVINQTNNEFEAPVYSVNYPAYWAYGGMGLAYKNIDVVLANIDFLDGKISTSSIPAADLKKYFESGDELYLMNTGTPVTGLCAALTSSSAIKLLWAFDKTKNSGSLTNTAPDFVFIDSAGKLYSRTGVKLRIVRSGRRNMLGSSVASAVMMVNPILPGTTRKLTININSKLINASAVEYKEKWQTDNDIIKKYSLVYDSPTCTYSEVTDCNGYLEKNINPYRKGLLGNFRTNQSKVFYGNRSDSIITATNLKQNGYLKDFALYWSFNASNNLIPVANAKWVWNSQVTRFNSRGLELETKDALNIYTAAQYGYNKTMPVAIANNARYNEMANEAFEDNNYQESINGSIANACAKKHVDFTNINNSQVFNMDSMLLNAHSGKYALGVNASATASKTFDVKNAAVDSFSLLFTKDTTKSLITLGGNYQVTYANPSNVLSDQTVSFLSNPPTVEIGMNPVDAITPDGSGGYNRFHYYTETWDTYINLTETKSYTFAVSLNTAYNNSGATIYTHSNAIGFQIYTQEGTYINSFTLAQNGFNNTSTTFSAFLCAGIYKISGSVNEIYSASDNGLNYTHNTYHWHCTNSTSYTYKSLSTASGCIFTKPLATKDSMMNPVFIVPANKKMLYSAWVRDGNNAISNGATTTSQVNISFNDGSSQPVTIRPVGPVIEGWQRYEGDFPVPATATLMTLNMVNNTASRIYFDDIRIHPYNANMKSYVYDPVNLRLTAELDANNYASYYEYDEEGTLIRTKAETKEGIKTINETRSFKQRAIKVVQ